MQTAAKERLTGALLVVLALVIGVPALLSDDRPRTVTPRAQNPEDGAPLQTYDIPLDGASALPAVPRDVPAAAAEMAAVPPPVTTTAAPQVDQPAATTGASPAANSIAEKPAGKSAPQAEVAAKQPQATSATAADLAQPVAPLAASGKWWVQLGVFASRDNAQQLAQKLRVAGFTIDVSQMRSNGKELYRVRAGPEADRSAVDALQARLAAAGQKKSSLVAP